MTYIKKDNGNYGGKRPGSGRKKLLDRVGVQTMREIAEGHGLADVEVERIEGKAYRGKRVKLVLDMLFRKAMQQDTHAAAEYLNRVMGKPVNTIAQEIDYTYDKK